MVLESDGRARTGFGGNIDGPADALKTMLHIAQAIAIPAGSLQTSPIVFYVNGQPIFIDGEAESTLVALA